MAPTYNKYRRQVDNKHMPQIPKYTQNMPGSNIKKILIFHILQKDPQTFIDIWVHTFEIVREKSWVYFN